MTRADPAIVAWERWTAAHQAYAAAQLRMEGSLPGGAGHRLAERDVARAEAAWSASLASLYATTPRSPEGLLRLLDAFETEDAAIVADTGLAGTAVSTICRAVRILADADGSNDLGPGPSPSGRGSDRRDGRFKRRQRLGR